MFDPAPTARAAGEADALVALFFLAWRGFAAEADAVLAREGLGRVHHRVLYAVARIPDISVGDLAASLGVSRQALQRPLADLVDRRLVTSRVSERSARERAIAVTARGARLEACATGVQRAQLERAFAEIGPDAAVHWVAVMRSLAAPVLSQLPGLVERLVAPPLAALADGRESSAGKEAAAGSGLADGPAVARASTSSDGPSRGQAGGGPSGRARAATSGGRKRATRSY